MKTKLQIFIDRPGDTNDKVCKLIANHNNGFNLFFLKEISAIIRETKNSLFITLKNLKIELIEDEGKLNVYEDGENLTYSIQENEYYNLEMVNDIDKEKQIAGEDALLLNPIYERNQKF